MKLSLSASQEAIDEAEKALGIIFPDDLKRIWLICNGLEYPQDWRIYPVFDRSKAKKCWGHIAEENRRCSYDHIQKDLLKIASDSYGNHLTLRVIDGVAGEDIFTWNHETTRLRKSPITFAKIKARAERRIEAIEKKIARSMKRKRR